jgi:hypothetical protein
LKAAEQHQQLAGLRDSWGNPGIPKDSEEKTGYADVESKERFPHPHSLDDGGEMKKPIVKMGAGRLPSIAESEITRCDSRRLWLIFLERARKLSHSVSPANPIRAFAGNLYKVRQVELPFHHRRSL